MPEITMPQLSDTMTEGTVVKWLKKEGDKVKSGEVIAEIETDKATMEMEAFEGGTISKITAPEGTKVAVGQPIAIITSGKEAAAPAPKQQQAAKEESAKQPEAVAVQRVEAKTAPPATPLNTREMREPDESQAHGATRENIETAPHPAPDPHDGRIRVSPLARKIAQERGVDLKNVKGS